MSNKNMRFLVPPLPALALASVLAIIVVVVVLPNNNSRVEAAAFSPALFSSSCSQKQQHHRSSKRRLETTTTTIYSFPFHHNDNDDGGSYSDGFLMKFHNQAQDEMQGETNALAQWNEHLEQEQQRSVKEWQDSFQRNGFADFTPPMSLGLNCLMIGGGRDDDDDTKLPWEDDAEASVTTMRMTPAAESQSIEFQQSGSTSSSTNAMVQVGVGNANDNGRRSSITNSQTTKALCTIKPTSSSMPFSKNNNNNKKKNMGLSVNPKMAAAYDCIVDRGLLNGMIDLKDHDNAVQELLWDAATALREHGIYVFVSNKSLLPETKSLLEECGLMAGLEWEFELDGISSSSSSTSSSVVNANAEQQQSSTTEVVSVARRFCNGAMPNVGRLSRFQR